MDIQRAIKEVGISKTDIIKPDSDLIAALSNFSVDEIYSFMIGQEQQREVHQYRSVSVFSNEHNRTITATGNLRLCLVRIFENKTPSQVDLIVFQGSLLMGWHAESEVLTDLLDLLHADPELPFYKELIASLTSYKPEFVAKVLARGAKHDEAACLEILNASILSQEPKVTPEFKAVLTAAEDLRRD